MQRNLSLDILRILACIGVITIHTAGSPIVHNMVEQGTMWYNECLIMDALVRWSVPVFAMLTGFFMLNPNRELSIKQLLSKYVLRLFVALCVWSAFYAIALHKSFYPLGSQEGHFWYVGMCIGLYLALPIMRLIVQNKAMLAYFCWTWFFIKIYQFIGNFYILPIDMRDVLFVDYVGYALWGAYCKKILPKINKWLLCAIAGGGLFATVFAAIITQNDDTEFFSYTSPNVIVLSIILFYLFSTFKIQYSTRVSRIIQDISNCTFGIYLIHLWILVQVFFRVHRFVEQPIILTIICVGMAFIGGFVITFLLKKIPFINKYIC